MSAIPLLLTPCSLSSRTRLVKTWFAVCARVARPPIPVASCAMRTVVWRTMASISTVPFTGSLLPRAPRPN